MKRSILVLFLVLVLASASSAQLFIGARASGMGGAGVSTSFDNTAAYYNPACLMKAGNAGFQGSAASAYDGLDKIMAAAGTAGDPAKFINDNFATNIDVNGRMWGLVGGNFNKVGVTLLPTLVMQMNKPANSLTASGMAIGGYTAALTLGHSFELPALPALHVGTNLKYMGGMYGGISANAISGGFQQYGDMSGTGLDVGALMSFEVPMVTSINVGVAIRDLAQSMTTSRKQKTLTANITGDGYIEGPEQDLGSATATADSSFVLGASGTIPVVGVLVAADLESGNGFSNTHFGVEYPVLAGLLALRAGVASGTGLSMTTLGAKIGIPFFPVNMAMLMDGNDSKNNSLVFDFGMAL